MRHFGWSVRNRNGVMGPLGQGMGDVWFPCFGGMIGLPGWYVSCVRLPYFVMKFLYLDVMKLPYWSMRDMKFLG